MSDKIKIDAKQMERLRKEAAQKEHKDEKPRLSTGTIVFRTVMALVAAAYFVLLIFGKYFLPEDGEFLRSLNIFSGEENPNRLIRICSYVILTLSASYILRFLIGRLAKNKKVTKRTGVAVIELLGNLVKYAAILVMVFLVLSALGVDTAELFAGLGILTLILGLGVTSLIEDIVAGIFIIAERLFDVGDVVVLDGFRGTVASIGIRSTQIADVGGDVLIVRNSSIGSLVNLTDRMSSAAITIPIAPQESLQRVEEIIKNAHIENIAKKNPNIKSGPIYIGLCDISSKGVQSLLFVAGCHEDYKFEIQRVLYKELKLLFESNGIKLGAPGFEET